MRTLYSICILPFLLLCLSQTATAQTVKNVEDSTISITMFDIGYAYQIPGADLAKRFGNNSALSLGMQYKIKSNWIFGLHGSFIFGDNIREDTILKNLSTSNNQIITNVGTYAEVYQYQRGYTLTATIGKIIPAWGPNKNTGIILSAGVGFINHKIRFEVADNNVYPLGGDYKTGYDRKTNGLCLTQFVGYRYMGNRRLLNFFAGFEFIQGFTQNRRAYNFDLMGPDHSKRLDLLYGIKVGWVLPIYRRDAGTYFYN